MGEALDKSALDRWRRDPTTFITEVMLDPETGKAFELLPCERAFLEHAFKTNADGRLIYPEQIYSCPKKTGKSAFNGMLTLTTTLVHGGPFAEAYCVANDLEQAQGRVFQAIKRIVEASPLLRREAKIVANRITFPETGAVIQAIASDYAGAAGANPTISSFDELWGYTSERSNRLWDEMSQPPTRKIACRLTTTYAGFEGESE
jgi:phage terminase large subunit-like protein